MSPYDTFRAARVVDGFLAGPPRPLDCDGVHRAVGVWQPYAGMVHFHMLLAGPAGTGHLAVAPRVAESGPSSARFPGAEREA